MNRWSSLWDTSLPPLPRGFGLRGLRKEQIFRDLDQFELEFFAYLPSPQPDSTLAVLRRRLRESNLSMEDFAPWVLGRDVRTLHRYLQGARIPHAQACWINRLEHVGLHGEKVLIMSRRPATGHRWEGQYLRRKIAMGLTQDDTTQ